MSMHFCASGSLELSYRSFDASWSFDTDPRLHGSTNFVDCNIPKYKIICHLEMSLQVTQPIAPRSSNCKVVRDNRRVTFLFGWIARYKLQFELCEEIEFHVEGIKAC